VKKKSVINKAVLPKQGVSKMKKALMVVLLSGVIVFGVVLPSSASDWDMAGKILTGIEGLRIVSGGRIDPVGSMFRIGENKEQGRYSKHKSSVYYHHKRYHSCSEKVWVPNYRWKKKYIPRHEKYHKEYGKIIVEGHYIKYKVKRGGHWETKYYCG